ncbi:MAG: hypothetical protein LRY41_02620 [Candidatus Pacebacteria bacterium]|nr:hypothetical protein [Candidatus Paceibacterota bacterium]MCD8508172.1 hypothetical protein [Candidatus Paceibacterota bacterium]MCD8528194.1 hypothetical protein [Candidatus Paceibacterota bacterium]MCD8563465.1 hypothetical protein [Candidatus Paceibacterota bacterium]
MKTNPLKINIDFGNIILNLTNGALVILCMCVLMITIPSQHIAGEASPARGFLIPTAIGAGLSILPFFFALMIDGKKRKQDLFLLGVFIVGIGMMSGIYAYLSF